MEKLQKHLLIPLFVAALLIIVLSLTFIYANKNKGTLELHDLSGDRSVLDQVKLSGELRDGYHSMHFALVRGEPQKSTVLLTKPERPLDPAYVHGLGKYFDGIKHEARVSIWGQMNFDLYLEDRRVPRQLTFRSAHIQTGLRYPAPSPTPPLADPYAYESDGETREDVNRYTFINDLNYGITRIGERVYFTVPTTRDYTGMNAIYEVTEFLERRDLYEEERQAKELVPISLEQNEDETKPSLEILGLESTGETLVLLLVEDDRLIVKGFSMEGEELGEAVIDNFALYHHGESSSAERYHASYAAYPDHDVSVLNLVFTNASASTEQETVRFYLSVDFSNGAQVVHQLTESYLWETVDRFNDLTLVSYRDEKLFLLQSFRETWEESGTSIDILRAQHFKLRVYSAGQRVYEGELLTDINDDMKHGKYNPSQAGFGYDPIHFRQFVHVKVESMR